LVGFLFFFAGSIPLYAMVFSILFNRQNTYDILDSKQQFVGFRESSTPYDIFFNTLIDHLVKHNSTVYPRDRILILTSQTDESQIS